MVGGVLSGSLALLADAGHMSPTRRQLLFALLAVRTPIIRLFATHGWLRLTTLAAFVNAIALVVITLLIVWEAIEALLHATSVAGNLMMVIAVARVCWRTCFAFWILHREAMKNLNVRAAAHMAMGDLLGFPSAQ